MREMGDPMIPAHAGLCIGAAKKVSVLMDERVRPVLQDKNCIER